MGILFVVVLVRFDASSLVICVNQNRTVRHKTMTKTEGINKNTGEYNGPLRF